MNILQRFSTLMMVLLLMTDYAQSTPKPPLPDEITSKSTSEGKVAAAIAIFAGGCFWCMEKPFDKLDGVASTTSGYIGGHVLNPTYKQVSAGGTGHYEALKVVYDPQKVSYESLLDVFWRNVDPVDGKGQFCDKGTQYLSAIFVNNDEEQKKAQASLVALEARGSLSGEISKGTIKTQILPTATFYPAEEYHQNYYQKNPLRYRYYRGGCGRDKRLKALWGEEKHK